VSGGAGDKGLWSQFEKIFQEQTGIHKIVDHDDAARLRIVQLQHLSARMWA